MSSMWIGIGTAAAGLIGGMAASNKQSKSDAAARDLNYQAQKEAEQMNWANWLASRGIAPGPNMQVGVIPGTVEGQVVNTRLPLWMNVSVPQRTNPATPTGSAVNASRAAAAMPFLVKKGA
jgi:hypothetical protein